MALYGYAVIAGIIIWCGVAMGTRGAQEYSYGGVGIPKCPPYVQKRPPICTYVCRLAWCVQHHVSSRSTILLFYHGSRHSLDIQMEPYINHSV